MKYYCLTCKVIFNDTITIYTDDEQADVHSTCRNDDFEAIEEQDFEPTDTLRDLFNDFNNIF